MSTILVKHSHVVAVAEQAHKLSGLVSALQNEGPKLAEDKEEHEVGPLPKSELQWTYSRDMS